jgi:NADPH:quinone reductase-like Zn-dependent oxidoreductase
MHLRENQTILVHAGAGGVGGFAVQLASYVGAMVISTASAHNADYVRQLGAHYVIDYNTEDIPAKVRTLTGGRGVDAIVDVIGKESATAGLEMLAFGGSIACIESMPELTDEVASNKAISIHRIMLGGAYLSGDRFAQDDLARMGRELSTLVLHKVVSPMLTETIALEDIPEALARLQERHVRGKIVARVE